MAVAGKCATGGTIWCSATRRWELRWQVDGCQTRRHLCHRFKDQRAVGGGCPAAAGCPGIDSPPGPPVPGGRGARPGPPAPPHHCSEPQHLPGGAVRGRGAQGVSRRGGGLVLQPMAPSAPQASGIQEAQLPGRHPGHPAIARSSYLPSTHHLPRMPGHHLR